MQFEQWENDDMLSSIHTFFYKDQQKKSWVWEVLEFFKIKAQMFLKCS